jgi:hypothetical protein
MKQLFRFNSVGWLGFVLLGLVGASAAGGMDPAGRFPSGPTLRELADKAGLSIGVRASLRNSAQKALVERDFNTATRTCYPYEIDPAPGRHDFQSFHEGVDWLYARKMKPLHHMLIRVQDVPMWQWVDAWKGFTAKEANRILGRKGQFWQQGYWDAYMRDAEHESRTRRYIENNPAKAKTVSFSKAWPWSGSRFRDAYERLCLPAR